MSPVTCLPALSNLPFHHTGALDLVYDDDLFVPEHGGVEADAQAGVGGALGYLHQQGARRLLHCLWGETESGGVPQVGFMRPGSGIHRTLITMLALSLSEAVAF